MQKEFKKPRRSQLPSEEARRSRLPDISLQEHVEAPEGPGEPRTWTTGAKTGIGTAFYDPDNPAHGDSLSNVWYTLSHGTLNEVYYPDINRPNLHSMQIVVTDGNSFTDLEETATEHEVQLVESDALIYKQINTAKNGCYRIEKTYITNPFQHAVLIEIDFHALKGHTEDYQIFIYADPALTNHDESAYGEMIEVKNGETKTCLAASSDSAAMVIGASLPLVKASTGYRGTSDGLKELKEKFQLKSIYTEAVDGNIAQIAEVELPKGQHSKASFTFVIGFGEDIESAAQATMASLEEPFQYFYEHYHKGWQYYLSTLHKPQFGSKEQYNVAAMVLKAHEDKIHPGAIIASLTIPWGDQISSTADNVGGYHLIWSRDLYQVASTMAAIGDKSIATRALAYLDEVQQHSDGSFPQNSWLDGTAYWPGLQLDQIAFPILLADQLGAMDRYESMVKPAADFLVRQGPKTPQERWEENAGYSPSTIAAEIAGLVIAAKMARQASDYVSAVIYLATADRWAREIELWSVTTAGKLWTEPHYIRVSDTATAADEHLMEIKNGGGWHLKSEVVDAGFLELVRLGIKAADDPLIVNSINVVDRVLKFDADYGPLWHRYNHDGYGEQTDGSAYEGEGIGRVWPFLSGERGEYEVALAASNKRFVPDNVYGAEKLLHTMAKSANAGYMIAEQVWDDEHVPERELYQGQGTGSATPLAWSMAQYLRLHECLVQNRIVEQPEYVFQRYVAHDRPVGPDITVEEPTSGTVTTDRHIVVRGCSSSGSTVVLHSRENLAHAHAQVDDSGRFELAFDLSMVGENKFHLLAFDNEVGVTVKHIHFVYKPPVCFECSDAQHDDNGPGTYVYPTQPDFKAGDFDLRYFRIRADDEFVYFEVTLGHLDNPWEGPSGLSKQLIDIYLHDPESEFSSTNSTQDLNALFKEGAEWQRLVRITGNWHGEANVYDADGNEVAPVTIEPIYAAHTVHAAVPISALGGVPDSGWGVMAIVAGEENGQPRPIRAKPSQWDFGGGDDDDKHPLIIDMLEPEEGAQAKILDWSQTDGPVQLPMIWI